MIWGRGAKYGLALPAASLILVPTRGLAGPGPDPINKITRGAAEAMIVEGLGKVPLGKVPVAIFKGFEFARTVGEAAVEREDRTRGAEIVLMHADAALIKGLVAQGQGNGPKAEAAKARLRDLRDRLDSKDPGDWNHLFNITAKHFDYAIGRASLQFGLKMGFKKFLKSDPIARFIHKYIHFGSEPASIIGNRSALRPLLSAAGWSKFGERARLVERYVDRATDKVLDQIIAKEFGGEIAGLAADALDGLHARVMEGHPSQPVIRRRIRYELALRPSAYAPLVLPFAAAAPRAPAIPVARAAAMPAPARAATPAQIRRVADPMTRIIYTEDIYVQQSYQAPESSQPTTYTPPPPPPPPPPPTARQIELHQELMCVGAGNKAGCERWTSHSGDSAQSTWDGRKTQRSLKE